MELVDQNSRPPTNELICKNLIKKLYNLSVVEIKELNGYDDRNYYIIAENECQTSNEYILKITNSIESNITGFIETLNALLLHLHESDLSVPLPIDNIHRNNLWYEHFDQSSKHAVRLFKFISGKLLYEITYTPSILYKSGALLAKLTNALLSFDSVVLRTRSSLWSLLSVGRIRDMLEVVHNETHQTIILDIISQFESRVLSRLHLFEWALIHGDFNEQNIIVEQNNNSEWEAKGMIDFGDVHYAPKVFDLAILLTYTMLKDDFIDPILLPAFALKGYINSISLKQSELNILSLSVKARLCQSLVIGAYSHKQNPTNTYVLITAKTGWNILERLYAMTDNDLLNMWLDSANDAFMNKIF